MKNKNTLIPIIVFVFIFVLFLIIFLSGSNSNKNKYYCIDQAKGIKYTFKTKEKMETFCRKLNGDEDDLLLEGYDIYNDLINVDDSSFVFYPYINENKKLSIIIAISDCQNPEAAKDKAIKWFSDNNYNISDYVIEYEDSCI